MNAGHMIPFDNAAGGPRVLDCIAIERLYGDQLDYIEALKPRPSLHDCGNHFPKVPNYVSE